MRTIERKKAQLARNHDGIDRADREFMPTAAGVLRARTRRFAFDVIALVRTVPRNVGIDVVARQLVRAATGVAANHRAAGRSRSYREFTARLGVVLEEADECEFWLDALIACETRDSKVAEGLRREAAELRAIFSAALRTARTRTPNSLRS